MPAEDRSPEPPNPRLTALPIEALVELLRRAGALHVDVARIRTDIAAGAPIGTENRINVPVYLAWLVQRLAGREADDGA